LKAGHSTGTYGLSLLFDSIADLASVPHIHLPTVDIRVQAKQL
jgi:hypothetical protein